MRKPTWPWAFAIASGEAAGLMVLSGPASRLECGGIPTAAVAARPPVLVVFGRTAQVV